MLRLKVEMVDKLVHEAMKKGLKKPEAIIEAVRQMLWNLAKDFKYTDILMPTVSDRYIISISVLTLLNPGFLGL